MNEPEIGVGDPNRKTLTWDHLLAETYALYGQRFWMFFRVALPPVAVWYLFYMGKHVLIQAAFRHHWLKPASYSNLWDFARGIGLGYVEWSFNWFLSAFFFAAIASYILKQSEEPLPLSDAYTSARNRLGPVAVTAMLAWTAFFLGRGILAVAVTLFVDRVGWRWNFWIAALSIGVPLLMVAGLLSRFGLVIPELMQDTSLSLGQAFRRSVKKTEGWEVFFMLFLAKSAILGYALYWLAGYGLSWLWQHSSISQSGYDWVSSAIYICIAAMLESPLFIAFSVLHRELSVETDDAVAVPAIV